MSALRRLPGWALLAALVALAPALAAGASSASVHIEEMTSTELRERIDGGATTILIPVGGTEQNGPHMALGKHNVRARALAALIARRLGNAVVAPVVAYVPEGAIDPPAAHMRFAGTVSIPEATFESLLDSAARSFKRHGFRDVVFLGDHGGYQMSQERVASRLNREWAAQSACRVHALTDYYRVTQTDYVDALKARGFGASEIGAHAGLADTALSLAVDASLVRSDALSGIGPAAPGVQGDPRRATAELGRLGAERIVEVAVAAIRERTRVR